MLTKEKMDRFFYRIIAVDKHEIAVTIDASNKITLDKFREQTSYCCTTINLRWIHQIQGPIQDTNISV